MQKIYYKRPCAQQEIIITELVSSFLSRIFCFVFQTRLLKFFSGVFVFDGIESVTDTEQKTKSGRGVLTP